MSDEEFKKAELQAVGNMEKEMKTAAIIYTGKFSIGDKIILSEGEEQKEMIITDLITHKPSGDVELRAGYVVILFKGINL